MKDVQDELRQMFERRGADLASADLASEGVVRRTRRRQVGVALVTVIAVVGLALIPLFGSRLGRHADTRPIPAGQAILPEAPAGFTTAALPYASIAYPKGWYLLDTSPLVWMGPARPDIVPSGPVLQLANFDPDLPHAPRCMLDPDSLPPDGVLLTVGIETPQEAGIGMAPSGPWPVQLGPLPSRTEPVCAGMTLEAAWTAPSGLIYWASAGHGPDASDADVRAMESAFASLMFPPSERPWMSEMAAFQGQGTPRVILGTERVGSNIAEIVAYVELNKTLNIGVSSDMGPSDCCLGGAIAPHTGSSDQPVTSTVAITPNGTLVYGVISPAVASVEIRASSGTAIPVTPVDLPKSFGVDDRVVWGVAPGSDDQATMVGYDASGNILGDATYPTAPDEVIAEGVDPVGGPWRLYVEHTNLGDGLGFGFTEHGGGSGCCLQPLTPGEDFRLDGTGTGGGAPSYITAFASSRVAEVRLQASNGQTYPGQLFAMPSPYEPMQVALVLVPESVSLGGDLVALDAHGRELGRISIGP